MPAALSYPGVYIEELPSGVRTITGVATSIAAFVGRAQRGSTNRPVVINSYADFERQFGGLWADSPMSYAVRDFYVNGGGQAIIVRLFSPSYDGASGLDDAKKVATTVAGTAAKAVAKATTDAAAVANPPATPQSVAAAADVAVAAASTPDPNVAAGAPGVAAAAAAAAAKAVAKEADDKSKVEGATAASVAAATNAIADKAASDASTAAAPTVKATISAKGLDLEAASEGVWGNSLRARIDLDVSDGFAKNNGLNKDKLFNLTVRDTKGEVTEMFRNLSLEAGFREADKVLESESTLVRIKTMPATRPTAHADAAAGVDVWTDDSADSSKYSTKANQTGGDGNVLSEADFTTGPGLEGKKHGLYALKDADIFNLLCIPPHQLEDGDIESTLIDSATALCADRRAFMLIDPPSGWVRKDLAVLGVAKVSTPSKNAALFFPSLRQPDPLRGNQTGTFAPCGAVAGIFARTDSTRGVWKAPAGLDAMLAGVPELSVLLNDLENGELNKLGVNCLRTMPAAGRVVWGSRTRLGDDRLASEWKYVPVRRTALFLEESLYRGTQWVVFEPNDEPLWGQIRLNIGAFMQNLFRQGAFQGRTPREAYFVKCDHETTTQNDIDLGIVNIIVGFAPLKPAEFVVIKLQQIAGDIVT